MFNIDMIACQLIGSVSISGEDFEFGNILTLCRAAFAEVASIEETEGSHISSDRQEAC